MNRRRRDDGFISREQAAERLGIAPSTLANNEELRAALTIRRLPGLPERYDIKSVERLLEQSVLQPVG